MKNWFKSGSPWIWMTAGAVSISLISVLGLLLMIAWKGLVYFWPSTIYEFEIDQPGIGKSVLIGEIYDKESIPSKRLTDQGIDLSGHTGEFVTRYLVKTGNREFVDLDFRWVLETNIVSRKQPMDLAMFERSKNGNFYGYVVRVEEDGHPVTGDNVSALYRLIDRSSELADSANDLQNDEIGSINYELERQRLAQRALDLQGKLTDEAIAEFDQQKLTLQQEYHVFEEQLFGIRKQAARDNVVVRDMRGEEVNIPLNMVLDVTFPNDMNWFSKVAHFVKQLYKFISDDPREANTEGGVFPAIFGTVFMVMLMGIY